MEVKINFSSQFESSVNNLLFFYKLRLPPEVIGVDVGAPVGHGFEKRLVAGEPGTMLKRRVVVNVLRDGDEKSILREKTILL